MSTLPAARVAYLMGALLLLACPICSLGSRATEPSAGETVAWAAIVTATGPSVSTAAPTSEKPTQTATALPDAAARVTARPRAASPTAAAPEPSAVTGAPTGATTPDSVSTAARSRGSLGEGGSARRGTATTVPTVQDTPTALPTATAVRPTPIGVADLAPEMLAEPGQAAAPASSSVDLADLTQLHPMLMLRPELRQYAAPAWVQEGVRVTYEAQSATLSSDPENPGGGAAGLLQYDLVALDDHSAVSTVKFWLDSGTGGYSPSVELYTLGVPGSGEYWVHPEALWDVEDLASDELTVGRLPTEMGGATFQAVRLEYRPEGAEYIWMFDEATGLLLFYRHAMEGNNGPQVSIMSLLSVRQVEVPWAGATAPDWARPGATFAYEGSYTPVIASVGPTPLAYTVSFEVLLADDRWWLCNVGESTAGIPGNLSQRLSGASQLAGALWIPPEGLGALQEGQVLDSDPATGTELTVAQVGNGVVVLAESGTLHNSTLTYDAQEGLLLSSWIEVYSPLVTTQISLELTQWP